MYYNNYAIDELLLHWSFSVSFVFSPLISVNGNSRWRYGRSRFCIIIFLIIRLSFDISVPKSQEYEPEHVDPHQSSEKEELHRLFPKKKELFHHFLNIWFDYDYTCLGIPLIWATTITMRLPKATVNNQAACMTDFMLAGAYSIHY